MNRESLGNVADAGHKPGKCIERNDDMKHDKSLQKLIHNEHNIINKLFKAENEALKGINRVLDAQNRINNALQMIQIINK